MIMEIDPVEPEPWLLARAAQVLRGGGVVVMPTDTVYGMTCGITHHKAIRRIYKLKDMDPKKPLSILVGDMSMVGHYTRGVSTPAFRLLKRVLPGPYTFIFEASPEVPKIMLRKRRTVGIRMPDNPIALSRCWRKWESPSSARRSADPNRTSSTTLRSLTRPSARTWRW